MSEQRVEAIKNLLGAALEPQAIDVTDDSHMHAGHPGARDGRGHFSVTIVSSAFDGKRLLARHRLVYDALGTLMQTDIHALAIEALTPDEASAATSSQ